MSVFAPLIHHAYVSQLKAFDQKLKKKIIFIEATETCENYGYRLCGYDVLKAVYPNTALTEDFSISDVGICTQCQQKGCLNTGCNTNVYPVWARNSDNFQVKYIHLTNTTHCFIFSLFLFV